MIYKPFEPFNGFIRTGENILFTRARYEPKTSSKVRDILPNGKSVYVKNYEGLFYFVEYEKDNELREAYVRINRVTKTCPKDSFYVRVISKNGVFLRENNTLFSLKKDRIDFNEVVHINRKVGNWGFIFDYNAWIPLHPFTKRV